MVCALCSGSTEVDELVGVTELRVYYPSSQAKYNLSPGLWIPKSTPFHLDQSRIRRMRPLARQVPRKAFFTPQSGGGWKRRYRKCSPSARKLLL
jgi:hypothetical protein